MRKVTFYSCFLLYGLLFSCRQAPSTLESVLQSAGDNRPALEKVLDFYSGPEDSLKYKAACFLIENMYLHYSFKDSVHMERFYRAIDSVYTSYAHLIREQMEDAYSDLYFAHAPFPESVADPKVISTDFLIDNIEQAFDVWQHGEWATHISFDQFCEYLLPYKVTEYQTLDNWREYLKDAYKDNLDELHHCGFYRNAAFQACLTVVDRMRYELNPIIPHNKSIPVRRLSALQRMRIGTCQDYSILALGVLRAKGIPVTMDYIPQYPNRHRNHSWCVLLDNTGKHIPFDPASSGPGETHLKAPFGKVFRQFYSADEELLELVKTEKRVPENFYNVCIRDVTDEYTVTTDVALTLENIPSGARYAYLAVFDDRNWIPVQMGKLNGQKAVFKKMGREVVYLPVCWGPSGMIPVGNPFLLDVNGKVSTYKADTLQKQVLEVYRKYPASPDAFWAAERMMNGKIQVADHPDFRDSLTIYVNTTYPTRSIEFIPDTVSRKYRYWRYYPNWDTSCNIAELYFYPEDSDEYNTGRIIGTPGSYQNNPHHTKEKVFDGDPLTFFDAPFPSECWVGMDFGKPVRMKRINMVSRGDGNCVHIGDEYELVYWGDTGWESLGKRTADNVYLIYENCPENALFLLHNHTTGMQERIFTYENGEQIWW